MAIAGHVRLNPTATILIRAKSENSGCYLRSCRSKPELSMAICAPGDVRLALSGLRRPLVVGSSRDRVFRHVVRAEKEPIVVDDVNWSKVQDIMQALDQQCSTSIEGLQKVAEAMVEEMKLGLQSEGGSKFLKMVITYVDSLPNGNEKGLFYALDLGGTNFRVLRVQLNGKEGVAAEEFSQATIPQDLMVGSEKDLFDFIVSKLANFVESEGEKFRIEHGRERELGFTFSFPVHQTAICSGTLIKWSKGFSVAETVGKDIVQPLKEAMHRQGLNMEVSALVNDTVGTLAGGRFHDNDVMVAIIFGTGTNACYVEDANAIPKLHGPPPESGYMVINTEWGNFWSTHLPVTEFDIALDVESVNPGDHIFEKLVSGLYLGEITRRVLLKLAEEAALFGDTTPARLRKPYVLTTPNMSEMHGDKTHNLKIVATTLEKVFGVSNVPLRTRKLIVELCKIITLRAARLAGAGIVGVLKKIGRDKITDARRTVVAIDGGLFEHYTFFREHMENAVVELLGSDVAKTIELKHSKDGSGIGATLLAASNSKYANKS